jgi:hypothetical protein
MSENDVTNKKTIVTREMAIMDKTDVTKRGRARKYKSNVERQRAYRKRRASEEAERVRLILGRRANRRDPNKTIDDIVLHAVPWFTEPQQIFQNIKENVQVDRARIPGWIASLRETRRNLNRFMRFLKKL